MKKHYSIEIARRWWFPRRYHCTWHAVEFRIHAQGQDWEIAPRLVIALSDGSTVIVPNILSRTWRVYPEFVTYLSERAEAAHGNEIEIGLQRGEPTPAAAQA